MEKTNFCVGFPLKSHKSMAVDKIIEGVLNECP